VPRFAQSANALRAPHQAELTEQLGLIEVEMLRGQLFAANVVARHPAEVDEAQNLLAAVHGRVRCNELGVFAPRIGVRIPGVERLDVPFDDVLRIGHQLVPPVGCRV
jgi:hypothetical protein